MPALASAIRRAASRLRRRPAVRPLPLAIAAMVALLLCKLAIDLGGVAPWALRDAAGAVVPSARASAATSTPPTPPAAKPSAVKPPDLAAAQAPAPIALPSPCVATPPGAFPPPPGTAELAVLQDLRARRTALDARAAELDTRQSVLTGAEHALSARLQQLTALQTRLEALDKERRDRNEANWQGLVKTYEAMPPRDAAAIFNGLEQTTLLQVLDRMKDRKTAAILAAMQPERARAATLALARWRARTTEEPQQ